MAQRYIGIYSTKERPRAVGDFSRPMGRRKRMWFVWEMPEGGYKAQPLNAASQPMAEARMITDKEFTGRFTYEEDCLIAPEGAVHPGSRQLDAASVSLPDLFLGETGNAPLTFPAVPDGLRADDPDLLLHWASTEQRSGGNAPDPAKISFEHLVGEVGATGGEEAASAVADMPESAAGDAPENWAERRLRSRFVQALLLLRRGARTEGLTLLEEMLREPHEDFQGGAQLFSEFGLGLRRLGFLPLALAAHKRALAFAPADERILFNIARSCHDSGLLAEARDFLEQALAVSPEFASARQFLAFIEASVGDAEHA